MITIRPARERGHVDHGWLDTYHSFSFANYHDPAQMGFRALRVLNDDTVAPGRGFGTHRHEEMEIVSYVLEGAMEHRDSTGAGSVLRPGDVQRMSAGTGVTHSEFNHSDSEPLHFVQIWLLPGQAGLDPGYEEKHFGEEEKRGRLRLIVSPDGRDESLTIHQDASIYATIVDYGDRLEHKLDPGRHAWVQVMRGNVVLNDLDLVRGDGVAVSDEPAITLEGRGESELLLFDLA